MGTDIRVRRVYDEPSPEDGARVLVDRVWPRGMRKDAARLDEWAKDVAPSTELRTWYQPRPGQVRANSAAGTPPNWPSPERGKPSTGSAPSRRTGR